MAGESPDRSERERSSGETTENTGSVPTARRQDPREAYAAAAAGAGQDATEGTGATEGAEDRAGGGGEGEASATGERDAEGAPGADEQSGDARLRAAVAAWVSTTDADGAEPTAEEGAGGGKGAEKKGGDASAGTGAGAHSDLPVRPRGAATEPGGREKPAADTATTMFGVRRDVAEPTDKQSAAARAERMTSAFFGSSRTSGAKTDRDAARPDDEACGRTGQDDNAPVDEDTGAPGAAGDTSEPAVEATEVEATEGERRSDAAPSDTDGTAGTASPTPARSDGGDEAGRPDADVPGGDARAAADASPEERGVAATDASPTNEGDPGSTGSAARGSDATPGTETARDGGRGAAGTAGESTAEVTPPKAPGDKVSEADTAEPRAADTEAERDGGGAAPATTVSRALPDAAGAPAGAKPVADDHGDEGKPGAEPGARSATPKPEPGGAEEKAPEGGDAGAVKAPPSSATAAPAAPAAPAAGAARQDHPTTAIRLPREEKPASEAATDRGASRYVPLRSADEARRPLPDAETASTTTPASTLTGVGGEQERTKQQPVPEPPPLELLAQLTNTPPPPETPLRTAVRRVKIWTPLVLLLLLVFVVVQSVRPLPEPTLTLTEQATYTFDGGEPSLPWPSEGQAYVEVSGLGVLGSYGEQKPVPIGSVAKTMTAYLVLQKSPLKEGEDGPKITVDQKAEDGGNRGAGNGNESVLPSVEKGDRISQRDALSALMIPSANNIARLLARWHSGSEEAFVAKMNETAEELGMENTTYTDPSGLEETTVSTAEDQVKLGKKVMEIPALVAITKQPYWTDPFSGERMRNWNTVVSSAGAIGIKTGTTTVAGGNLLFAGHEEIGGTRQLVVGAVLGQHKPPIIDTVNAVSDRLLTAAEATLTSEKIVEKGDVVGYLDDGLGGRTPVVATEDVAAVGWGGVEVDLALEPLEEMPHAAPAGKKVGTLTVGGGPGQVEVPVALQEDLAEPAFGDKLTRIL